MRFKRYLPIYIFAFLVFAFGSGIIFGQKLDHRLGQFIVLLDPSCTPDQFLKNLSTARSTSAEGEFQLLKVLNADWNMILIGYDYVHLHEDKVRKQLQSLPCVHIIQRNHLIQFRKKPNDTYYDRQWYHFNNGMEGGVSGADFRSELAWDHATGGLTENGDTIVLCVIDDGLDINHYDIRANHWKNFSEIPSNGIDDDGNGYIDDFNGWNTFNQTDVFDKGRHGTPVCGIAAARGNNNLGVAGMIWNVKLMFVSGGGDEASAIMSYSYPWQARRAYNLSGGKKGAFVVATNSSWGADYRKPEEAPLWCAVYDSLGAVGILNAASTTNLDLNVDVEGDLPTTCTSDFLITVTNMDWFDQKDQTSGYGPVSVDLGAFGENVFTLAPDNSLGFFRGTSAASPQIAGAIALLYSMPCNVASATALSNPSGAALQFKQLILNHVRPIESLKGVTVSGGVLDLERSSGALLPVISSVHTDRISFKPSLPNLKYPVLIEFREKGSVFWIKDSLNSVSDSVEFKSLNICGDYEYRISGGCDRWKDFSPIQNLTTGGCCLAPSRAWVLTEGKNEVWIKLNRSPGLNEVGFLIKASGQMDWDTVYLPSVLPDSIRVSGLIPCNQYECRFFSFCGGDAVSGLSEKLVLRTSGCENCTDKNYCNRGRPQSQFEWIESVGFDGDRFVSGNNTGYGNFVGTGRQWLLQRGQRHEIEIRPGYSLDSSRMHMVAWIDFNGNGIFENSETIIPTGTIAKGIQKFQFEVPANAFTGIIRGRVMLKYGENITDPPMPCGQGLEFGEYEDYCLTISDQVCGDISDVLVSGITSSTAWVQFTKERPGDEVYYQYRKSKELLWTSGITRNSDLVLSGLDSCTAYELRLNLICSGYYTGFYKLGFNTQGTPCQTTGSNPVAQKVLEVFPNPFGDFFTIHYEGWSSIPTVRIFDSTGKLLSFHMLQLSRDHCRVFPEPGLSGIFLIELTDELGNRVVQRLVRIM